jgi:hypothetical protein
MLIFHVLFVLLQIKLSIKARLNQHNAPWPSYFLLVLMYPSITLIRFLLNIEIPKQSDCALSIPPLRRNIPGTLLIKRPPTMPKLLVGLQRFK